MLQTSLGLKLPTIPIRIMRSAERRVAKGAVLLDELGPPDWRDTLLKEKARLNIAMAQHCAAGLIYGDYYVGCCELGLEPATDEPAHYGFNALNPKSPRAKIEFQALDHAWIAAAEKSIVSIAA